VRYPIFSGGRVGLVDSSPSRAGDLEYSELAVPSAVYILPDGAGRESVRFARSPPGRMHEWAAQTIWGPAPDGEILDVALAISPEGGPGGQPHVALLEVGGVHLLDPSTTPAGDLVVDPGPVDGVGDPSVTIAIALDATGATHLAWVAPAPGPAHGEIRYATDASGTWEVQIVGSGDGWADLALDHRGNPHMSWHTEQRGAEKAPHPGTYATFAPIDGVDENCDGVDGVDADGDGSPGSHK